MPSDVADGTVLVLEVTGTGGTTVRSEELDVVDRL